MIRYQIESPQVRDPHSGIIKGAESYQLGTGYHAVLLIHGWTSSPRDFLYLAPKIAELGLHCRVMRLRGHGESLRSIRNITWNDFLNQVLQEYSELSRRYESVSVCGFSFGGLLALHLALRRKVKKLILLAPFLRSHGKFWGLIENDFAIRHFSDFYQYIPKEWPPAIGDPHEQTRHISYVKMPAAMLRGFLEAIRQAKPYLRGLHSPTLIVHGRKDKTSAFSGSEVLLEALGSNKKKLVYLANSEHILTLDREHTMVEAEVCAWLAMNF